MVTLEQKKKFGVYQNQQDYEYFTAVTTGARFHGLKVSENFNCDVEMCLGEHNVIFTPLQLLSFIQRLTSWLQRQTFVTAEEEQEVEEANANL